MSCRVFLSLFLSTGRFAFFGGAFRFFLSLTENAHLAYGSFAPYVPRDGPLLISTKIATSLLHLRVADCFLILRPALLFSTTSGAQGGGSNASSYPLNVHYAIVRNLALFQLV